MSDHDTPTMKGELCVYEEILDARYSLAWNVMLINLEDLGVCVHLLDAQTGALIMASKHVSEASAELLYGALARALGARAQFDRVVGRLLRLEAIVDKLPKTADGVPAVPGMVIFTPLPLHVQERRRVVEVKVDRVGKDLILGRELLVEGLLPYLLENAYSTREAAEAALEVRP